ncbi:MAG: TetR family transcriptional regulator [Clostridia bacterium]|nr:TetR family transcriptional regulator [Clostridia bacterium]
MQEKPDKAEMRILEAAIACIEEYGLHGTTIRRIAAKASVNTAAINYYFRTKEQLLDRVMELTLNNAFDWSDLTDTENLPPKERLLSIIRHLNAGAQHFPELCRAHFDETIVNGNYDTRSITRLNEFMEQLFRELKGKGCTMSDEELKFSIEQVFVAGIFGAGMMPGVSRSFLGLDLTRESERERYLRHLVDRLMD